MGELQDKLALAAAEAEAGEADQTDRPLPANVKVSRPNRARTKVLQVRLTDGELAALEAIAAERGQAASTVAREQLLSMIAMTGSALDVLTQVAAAADRIKELVNQAGPLESNPRPARVSQEQFSSPT